MNPYDACVANKMINGKQFTIVWHVDDLKASQVSLDVRKEFGNELNKEFGNETPIMESYEKKTRPPGDDAELLTPRRS